MAGQLLLTTVIILMTFGCAKSETLSCYQCNTDFTNGYKTKCNDPYKPDSSRDLVLCPQTESHQCFKGTITIRDLLVTTRGCVESRKIDEYCRYLPGATCSFCDQTACNGQGSIYLFDLHRFGLLLPVIYMIIKSL